MPRFNCLQCGKESYCRDRKVKLCSVSCAGAWRKAHHLTRRAVPLEQRFWSKVDRSGEHWLFNKPNHYGYGQIGTGRVLENGTIETIQAHRLAWELRTGAPVPKGMDVLHTCDIRNCVRNDDTGVYIVGEHVFPRYGHLWLGTVADNTADMIQKGRAINGRAKLTREQAKEVRERVGAGEHPTILATIFGVSVPTIYHIKAGRIWQ